MSKKQAETKKVAKSVDQAQLAARAVNLREQLMKLPKVMQEGIANYFNMYNCAAWLYNEILTQDAKDYVDQSIMYARELNDLEALPDTLDPNEQQKQVDEFNIMNEAPEKIHGK